MDPQITKLLFKIFIFIFLFFIAYKLIKLSHGFSKFFHAVYKGLTPPLKKIFLWQYKNIQIIGRNLIYTKKDLYSSLKNTEYVGTITEINTHKVLNNPIFRALLETSIIIIFISTIIYSRELTNELVIIGKSFLNAVLGVFLGFVTYKILKKEVPLGCQNKFLTSTLKSIGDELVIKNMLTDAEIKVLLSIPDYNQNDLKKNVKINFNEKKIKYELIYKYWIILIAEKQRTERLLEQNLPNKAFFEKKNHSITVYMNAFREIFTYLYQNKNVKAAPVQSGHGGVSLYEHTLWVVEHSIAFLIHEFFGIEREVLIGPLVLAALSHDIGKIVCFKNEDKVDFEGHELLSGNILGVLSECSELDNQTFNNVIHIIKNQKATLNDEQSENVRIIHRILQGADTMASEQEGAAIDKNIIRSMYRKAFMDLFKDISKLETFTCTINTYLFIDLDKFVPEMIKNTGQKYTIKNVLTSQAYKDILDFFTADLMLTEKFGNTINCVEFIYRQTNKTARIFKNCLILSLDYITYNKDYSDTFYVGLMKNNDPQQIAKLIIGENGSLKVTDKIDRITYDEEEIMKMNQQLINKAKKIYSKTNLDFVNNNPNFEEMLKQKPLNENLFIDTNQLDVGEIGPEGELILQEKIQENNSTNLDNNLDSEESSLISSYSTNEENAINIEKAKNDLNIAKEKIKTVTQNIVQDTEDFSFVLPDEEEIQPKIELKNTNTASTTTKTEVYKNENNITTVLDVVNKDKQNQNKNKIEQESYAFNNLNPFDTKRKTKQQKPMEGMRLEKLDRLTQSQTNKGFRKPTFTEDDPIFKSDNNYQTSSNENIKKTNNSVTESEDNLDYTMKEDTRTEIQVHPLQTNKPNQNEINGHQEIVRKTTSLKGGLKEAEEIIWSYFNQLHIGGINQINWDIEGLGKYAPCKYDGDDPSIEYQSYKIKFNEQTDPGPILIWYQSKDGAKAEMMTIKLKGFDYTKTLNELKERNRKQQEFLLNEQELRKQQEYNLSICNDIYNSMNINVDKDCIYTESVNIPQNYYEKNLSPLSYLRYYTMPENKNITSINIALLNMHVDQNYIELKDQDLNLLNEGEFFTGYTNIVDDNNVNKICLQSFTKFNYSVLNFSSKNKATILTEKLIDGLSILYLNNNVNILYLTNIKDIISNELFRNTYLQNTEIFLSADLLKNKYNFYKDILNTYENIYFIYFNRLFEVLNNLYLENYNDDLSQYRLLIQNLYQYSNFKEESIKFANFLVSKPQEIDKIPLLEAYRESMNELKIKFNSMVAEGITYKGKPGN